MANNSIPSSVTYILSGTLLQICSNVWSGWSASLVALFGFVVFYVGLGKMQHNLDNIGWKAASMLKLAAIVGAVAAFVDFIPLLGWLALVGYIVAFVIELLGFFKLKGSEMLNPSGKDGVTLLLIAMSLSIIQTMCGFIPYFGGYIATPFALAALALVFFGWTKVQDGVVAES